MLFGYLCGGWLLAKGALQAQAQLASGEGDADFLKAKCLSARSTANICCRVPQACLAAIKAGSESLMSMPEDKF